MTILVDDLVPDELWAIVEPLLPAPPRPPYGGRHRTIVGAPGQVRFTPTRHTTVKPTERTCGVGGSGRGSLGGGSSRRRGLGATGGGSSGRCPG
jgi:hypothetical protein